MANSVDPDETPHDAASHQGLRCLLKGISVRNILNIEINILDIPNFGNKLIQFRRMGESTRHKWVKSIFRELCYNNEDCSIFHSNFNTFFKLFLFSSLFAYFLILNMFLHYNHASEGIRNWTLNTPNEDNQITLSVDW